MLLKHYWLGLVKGEDGSVDWSVSHSVNRQQPLAIYGRTAGANGTRKRNLRSHKAHTVASVGFTKTKTANKVNPWDVFGAL